jgi:hypothetical protein
MIRYISKTNLAKILGVVSLVLFIIAGAMFIARLTHKAFGGDDVIAVLIASLVLQRLSSWLSRPPKVREQSSS